MLVTHSTCSLTTRASWQWAQISVRQQFGKRQQLAPTGRSFSDRVRLLSHRRFTEEVRSWCSDLQLGSALQLTLVAGHHRRHLLREKLSHLPGPVGEGLV